MKLITCQLFIVMHHRSSVAIGSNKPYNYLNYCILKCEWIFFSLWQTAIHLIAYRYEPDFEQ